MAVDTHPVIGVIDIRKWVYSGSLDDIRFGSGRRLRGHAAVHRGSDVVGDVSKGEGHSTLPVAERSGGRCA